MKISHPFHSLRSSLRRMALLSAVAGMLAGLALGAAPLRSVQAAAITVTTTSDELDAGPCATILPASLPGADGKTSLREAICAANNVGGASAITLPAPGTYSLTLGELPVGTLSGATLSLSGSGTAAQVIITRTSGSFRLFDVDPNQVGGIKFTVSHLTLQNGLAGSLGGGAILAGGPSSSGESLALNDTILSGNATSAGNNGGALAWEGGGDLSIQNTTFNGNTAAAANGGGLFVDTTAASGTISLSSVSFTNNKAGAGAGGGQGGGAYLALGSNTATLSNNTFSGNTAESLDLNNPGRGGGLYLASGSATLAQAGFTANAAQMTPTGLPGEGGAVYDSAATLTISYSRITGNTAASGTGLFHLTGSGSLTADHDWWGCNAGPGSAGCDGVGGTVNLVSRLLFTLKASPATIYATHSSTLSTGFSDFSTGLPVTTPALLGAFSGLQVPFGSPVLGVISGSPAAIVNGSASATFTAGAASGLGGASATLDNQAVSTPITILALKKIYLPFVSK